MTEMAKALMARDGLTEREALEAEEEAREAIKEALKSGEDPEEAFMDLTGLEPDYILELMDF